MLQPLSLAVAQPVNVTGDLDANVAAHAEAVARAHARVVVFPELSLTGYAMDAAALTPDDPRLAPLLHACASERTVALVGAQVAGPDGDHIAMLQVDDTGVQVVYRKVWVGADEAGRFVPGDTAAAVEVDGWRLGLAICRDTGIDDHTTTVTALGIDAYVAGTVMAPDEAAEQDRRGRSIATTAGIWVAFASFAGPTGAGYDHTLGRSAIWAPGGEPVALADDVPGRLVTTTLVPPLPAVPAASRSAGGPGR